jgi:hypothetical protein
MVPNTYTAQQQMIPNTYPAQQTVAQEVQLASTNQQINPPYTALTAQQTVVATPITREFQQQRKPQNPALFSQQPSIQPSVKSVINPRHLKDSFNKVFGLTQPATTTIDPFMALFGMGNQRQATTTPSPSYPTQSSDPFYSLAQSFEKMLSSVYGTAALTGQAPLLPFFEI